MKARKILVSVAALALVAAISIGGTLAYLTSQTKTVKNTFTVGNVKITLDEAVVDGNGKKTNDRTDATLDNQGNSYKLIPGSSYDKDPTVHVARGSEDCYVRVNVTVNKYSALKEVFGENVDLSTIFTGYDGNKWERETITVNGNDTVTYVYNYKTIATAEEDLVLFQGITLPATVNENQLPKLDGLNITITADAIQASGFTASADGTTTAMANAWAAFETQNPST